MPDQDYTKLMQSRAESDLIFMRRGAHYAASSTSENLELQLGDEDIIDLYEEQREPKIVAALQEVAQLYSPDCVIQVLTKMSRNGFSKLKSSTLVDDWTCTDENIKPETSVEVLDCSVRAYNVIKNADIETVGQLIGYSESDLLKMKNVGRRTIDEISEVLAEKGLYLKGSRPPSPANGMPSPE